MRSILAAMTLVMALLGAWAIIGRPRGTCRIHLDLPNRTSLAQQRMRCGRHSSSNSRRSRRWDHQCCCGGM